jgi:hypothetical protein
MPAPRCPRVALIGECSGVTRRLGSATLINFQLRLAGTVERELPMRGLRESAEVSSLARSWRVAMYFRVTAPSTG